MINKRNNEVEINRLKNDISKNEKKYVLSIRAFAVTGIASAISMGSLVMSPFSAQISSLGALGVVGVSTALCAASMYSCTKSLDKKERDEKEIVRLEKEIENADAIKTEMIVNKNLVSSNKYVGVRTPYKKQNRVRVLTKNDK